MSSKLKIINSNNLKIITVNNTLFRINSKSSLIFLTFNKSSFLLHAQI